MQTSVNVESVTHGIPWNTPYTITKLVKEYILLNFSTSQQSLLEAD